MKKRHLNDICVKFIIYNCTGGQAAQSAAKTAKEGVKRATTNSMMGISLEEAKQILNVETINKEAITKVSIVCSM